MLLGGLFLARDAAQWWFNVLISVGSAILLVVPLFVFTRVLDQHISEVRTETTTRVDALRDRVSSFEDEIERRLDDVARSVSAQLAEESDSDLKAFDALATTPSREGLEDALRRARELDLLDEGAPPRVRVSDSEWSYVVVDLGPFPGYSKEITCFHVEDLHGDESAEIPWAPERSMDEIMVRIGRAVQARSGRPNFDVAVFFRGLRDILKVAYNSPERRPIVELCPPQWAVTDRGIVTYGDAPLYRAPLQKLRDDPHFSQHVRRKPWVDAESFERAEMAVRELFPDTSRPR